MPTIVVRRHMSDTRHLLLGKNSIHKAKSNSLGNKGFERWLSQSALDSGFSSLHSLHPGASKKKWIFEKINLSPIEVVFGAGWYPKVFGRQKSLKFWKSKKKVVFELSPKNITLCSVDEKTRDLPTWTRGDESNGNVFCTQLTQRHQQPNGAETTFFFWSSKFQFAFVA